MTKTKPKPKAKAAPAPPNPAVGASHSLKVVRELSAWHRSNGRRSEEQCQSAKSADAARKNRQNRKSKACAAK